jgi:two-component system CheB/CheR fusion protein
MSDHPQRGFEALLDYLKRNRGFDFTGYKHASLARRIQKRMQSVKIEGYPEYIDYLEVHPEEFNALFNTILINVTSFFREPATWEYLAEHVFRELIGRKPAGMPIRVWGAGCASGEEAYTAAMILAEALGWEGYRERAKIYATDIDEEALNKGRQAIYPETEVEAIPKPLLDRYFDQINGNFSFNKELRRNVIFGRHDLIQDAPISRVDLIVCRNVLMYFNAETQSKILARFHFALNDGGILFLGRAETLLTHTTTFAPVDLKRRISYKVPRSGLNLRDRLILAAQSGADDVPNGLTQHFRVRESAVDTSPVAQIAVDGEGLLAMANERARTVFGLALADIGRPLQDLKVSYRPVELRSCLGEVTGNRRPMVLRDVEWPTPTGEPRWFELQLIPLLDPGGVLLGTSISYLEVTSAKRLQRELKHTNQELETAYEELQSTNEELETTNEELQSTVEELETTNEELQSTNEELETMNEELQSTNEELQTMNDELRQRGEQLNEVNSFLESILASLRGGVAVLDSDFQVVIWNQRSEDLWGLRADEVVGRNFLSLDIGLPVERLKGRLRELVSGERESAQQMLEATNRRGRTIQCYVTLTPLAGIDHRPRGVIVVMDDSPPPALVNGVTEPVGH